MTETQAPPPATCLCDSGAGLLSVGFWGVDASRHLSKLRALLRCLPSYESAALPSAPGGPVCVPPVVARFHPDTVPTILGQSPRHTRRPLDLLDTPRAPSAISSSVANVHALQPARPGLPVWAARSWVRRPQVVHPSVPAQGPYTVVLRTVLHSLGTGADGDPVRILRSRSPRHDFILMLHERLWPLGIQCLDHIPDLVPMIPCPVAADTCVSFRCQKDIIHPGRGREFFLPESRDFCRTLCVLSSSCSRKVNIRCLDKGLLDDHDEVLWPTQRGKGERYSAQSPMAFRGLNASGRSWRRGLSRGPSQ